MGKGQRQRLTANMINKATCPPGQTQARLWDSEQPGLLVRVYRSGAKTYWVRYRQAGTLTWYRIGDVDAISLDSARKAAGIKLGEVAKGADPAAQRREQRRRERKRLEPALDAYEKSLEERGVVKRGEYLSLLRRELLAPLGNIDLEEISLESVIKRINTIKAKRPGAAQELRTRASVFLSWCAAQGLIKVSPLAGYRQPRRTRQQRLAEQREREEARALSDAEIPVFWEAAEAEGWPFGPYLQTLLLTGQRRTETALMKWADVHLDRGRWLIPAEDTKSGRSHEVPLPPELVAILAKLPRLNRCPYVFPGRRGAALAGWSKRLKPVYQRTAAVGLAPWTLHDLRRTMRSGLTALGVDGDVAEMMLNHQIGDELRRIYDRHGYPEKRVDAAGRWAKHVLGLVKKARRAHLREIV